MKNARKVTLGLFLAGACAAIGGLSSSSLAQQQGRFLGSMLSGQCIDVEGAPGMGNGARLQLWSCELSGFHPNNASVTDQRWTMTSGGFIQNTSSGKCIDVDGAPGMANGTKLQLWDCEWSGFHPDNGSVTDQRWQWR
jgi:hypothetical protein